MNEEGSIADAMPYTYLGDGRGGGSYGSGGESSATLPNEVQVMLP